MPFLIILSGKIPARHRAVLAHYEVVYLPVHMNAVAINIVRDKIWSPEIPANNALSHILFRHGKGKFMAYRFAYV